MKTLKLNDPHMKLYMASMGKIFRVTGITNTTEEANAICEKDKSVAVIAEDSNGRVYLAQQYGAIAPSAILEDQRRVPNGNRAGEAKVTK